MSSCVTMSPMEIVVFADLSAAKAGTEFCLDMQ